MRGDGLLDAAFFALLRAGALFPVPALLPVDRPAPFEAVLAAVLRAGDFRACASCAWSARKSPARKAAAKTAAKTAAQGAGRSAGKSAGTGKSAPARKTAKKAADEAPRKKAAS